MGFRSWFVHTNNRKEVRCKQTPLFFPLPIGYTVELNSGWRAEMFVHFFNYLSSLDSLTFTSNTWISPFDFEFFVLWRFVRVARGDRLMYSRWPRALFFWILSSPLKTKITWGVDENWVSLMLFFQCLFLRCNSCHCYKLFCYSRKSLVLRHGEIPVTRSISRRHI